MEINLKRVSLVLCLAIGLVLGTKSLLDVDIGWHLAGGLWMLNAKQIPIADPFGAAGNYWWCYSWLVEVIFAFVFKLADFRGLQILQSVSVLLSCYCLWRLFWRLPLPATNAKIETIDFIRVIALLITIVFISPLWHLRPQLYSFILLTVLLELAERNQLKPLYLIPMIAVWSNIHLYWVYAPLIVFIYESSKFLTATQRPSLSAIASKLFFSIAPAFLNPYPLQQFAGMWNYIFNHQQAYGLITEFQNLSLQQGYLFWLWATVFVIVLLGVRKSNYRSYLPSFCLFLLFAILSSLRIKFVPIFGLIAMIVFCKQQIFVHVFSVAKPHVGTTSSKTLMGTAKLLVILFIAVTASMAELPSPLDSKLTELRRITNVAVEEQMNTPNRTILNHFDDGGWLALFLLLNNAETARNVDIKTSIDGRTLVMGEKRLEEFRSLQRLDDNWCEIIKAYDAEFALLPSDMKFAKALQDGAGCSEPWKQVMQGKYYVLLRAIRK